LVWFSKSVVAEALLFVSAFFQARSAAFYWHLFVHVHWFSAGFADGSEPMEAYAVFSALVASKVVSPEPALKPWPDALFVAATLADK
jgi:hypothetical protein